MNLSRREFAALAGGAFAAQTLLGGWPALAEEPKGDGLAALTLAEVSAMIHAGKVTPTELTMACLDRIAIYAPKLDCFITVMRDKALAQAALLDAEQKAGNFRGPLHGIPIALKDNIDTAGDPDFTAGSGVFPRPRPHGGCAGSDAPRSSRHDYHRQNQFARVRHGRRRCVLLRARP